MEETSDVAFAFPREGALISFDQFAIPKGAANQDLAYEFINFMYEPRVAAENMGNVILLMPNREAFQYLPEEFKELEVFYPSQEILEKLVPIVDLGEGIRLYQRAWEKVKESW